MHDESGYPAFLAGGGEMGERIRSYDWRTSPLGPAMSWPAELKALVSVMLASDQPMHIVWGPEGRLLYNDAHAQLLGQRHPDALGRPVREVWADIEATLAPILARAYAGEPQHSPDVRLIVAREGREDEAFFRISHLPIRDADGQVAGLFCPSVETTGQILADRRLEEMASRRGLLKEAPSFIGILEGPSHVFEFVNAAFVRLFGDRDYVGRDVREAFPELAGQQFYQWLDQVYRTGERFLARQVPMRVQKSPNADLELRFIDFIYEPIIDRDGQVTGIFIEGYDVTERKRAQDALRTSEMQFNALAQAIPDQVWTTAPDGRVDWYNDRFRDYAGAGAGELSGKGWEALVHPDDLPRVLAVWQAALESGTFYEVEMRLRRADGAYRHHLTRGVPLFDAQGAITRWVGTNTDIEAQKLAEDSLRQLNETLEQRVAERTAERDRVWRNSRDLLMVVGRDGVYRAANPAWKTVLGYRVEEVVGRRFVDFIWPDDRELTLEAHARALSNLPLTNLEKRYRHKDGTLRWISWTTFTEGDKVYGYGRDVTAEKDQAQVLRQTEEQLRQAQKMEAVGQLTGGIAHDFNNLLGGIIGSLELLQLRIAQGRAEQAGRYSQLAMSSAQRAAALIHRLLAFARRQPLDPHPVDANRLLEDMADLLRRTLGPAQRLEIVTAKDLWITRCDPNQLESSLLNLAINARDAMPEGGTLRLETGNLAHATFEGQAPGDYVWLRLTDNGTGMPPEVLERVLEPFFTTKAAGQGTGLGLSMVYGFAKQSHGHLRLDSTEGQGTCVTLYLPRHEGAIETPSSEPPRAPLPARAERTVLIVEDDAVIRELLAEVLQDLGYRTLTAIDGPSGLQLLKQGGGVDLMVSDIGLPGFSGHQLAMRARQLRPALKVLFITGYAEDATVAEGFLPADMEMITKPFDMSQLVERVQRLMQGG